MNVAGVHSVHELEGCNTKTKLDLSAKVKFWPKSDLAHLVRCDGWPLIQTLCASSTMGSEGGQDPRSEAPLRPCALLRSCELRLAGFQRCGSGRGWSEEATVVTELPYPTLRWAASVSNAARIGGKPSSDTSSSVTSVAIFDSFGGCGAQYSRRMRSEQDPYGVMAQLISAPRSWRQEQRLHVNSCHRRSVLRALPKEEERIRYPCPELTSDAEFQEVSAGLLRVSCS